MSRITCPECDAVFKLRTTTAPGAKVRCPKCECRFAVPDEDDGEDDEARQQDRPRRDKRTAAPRKKKAKSGALLWIVLGCGGLLALGGVAAVLLVVFWPFGKGGGPLASVLPATNSAVTKENYEKVDFDLTREEVEKILGSGRVATDADMDRAHPTDAFRQQHNWRSMAAGAQVKTWVQWRNGSDVISVGFASSQQGELSAAKIATFHVGGGTETMSMVVGGGANLAQARQRKQQTRKLLDDPKWAKGAEARKFLVGRWQHEQGWYYEFLPNGTFKQTGVPGLADVTSRYRVIGNDKVELTLPDLYSLENIQKKKMRTETKKFLVSSDELALFTQIGDQLLSDGTFRRVGGAGPNK